MENVTAQLNAFTKDGAKSAEILEMIKVRASQTPFAFEEMAKATASLLPASKASGVGLEDLIAQAEVLAASNPAEGLEGAAFALKEAVGGDFLSLVERFNLPKQRLNELKAEGVPALEAVQIAMGELGLDTDLVTNLANTASGRWSTFMDTLTGLAAVATKPIFDVFSGGLAQVNDWITKNQPLIDAFIAQLAQGIGNAIAWIASTAIPALVAGFQTVVPIIQSVVAGFLSFLAALQPVADFIQANLQPILFGIGTVIAVAVVPAIIAAGIAAVGAVASFALLAAPIVALVAVGALLYQAWATNFGGIQQIVMPVVNAVVQGFGEGGIGGAIRGLITSLQTAWPQIQSWFATAATAIAGQLLIWAQAFLNWIAPMIPPVLAALVGFASSIGNWIVQQAPNWLAQLMAWGNAFVAWIGPAMPLALAELGRLIDAFFNWIAAQAAPLIAKFSAWANALVAWIVPATVQFLAAWPGMLNSFLTWIGGAVGPILAKLLEWAGAFIGWVLPAIPGILAAVAGIAAALIVWIGQTVGVLAGKLLEWGMAFISWVAPKIPGILAAVGGIAVAILGWIGQQVGALAGKLAEWGAAFVSWVGAEVLPKLPGALADILTSIYDWSLGAAQAVLGYVKSIGTSVVDGIKKGISDAWGAFQGWIADQVAKIPAPIRQALGMSSPSRVMAEQVGLPIVQGIVMGVESGMSLLTGTMTKVGVDITKSAKGAITGIAGAFQNSKLPEAAAAVGRDIIAGWMGGMKENFSAIKGMAAEMGAATVTSLKGSFEIGSPSKLMSREIGIPIVDGITAGINIASPKLSERMLQLGTMLVDLVSKGVDAFGKLRGLGTISLSSITQFASTLQSAMTAFGEMTLRWDKAMMSAASQFTRKSGDVIDLMSKGVEMLGKLKDFEAVPADVFRSFSTALEAAILEIVRISTFANRQLLTHAQSFSEGAIKVIAVIGVGVDALNKLGTLAQPTAGAFLNFSQQVSFLVFRMGQAGAAMAVDTVVAAAQFAEGAGKVLGLLGTGVDGLLKLQDLTAPLPGTFLRFAEMVGFLVLRMAQVADQFDVDAVAAAAKFAEGAGKIIAIVGGGVDAFTKLKDFGPVSEESLGHFVNAIHFIVGQLILIASTFEAEAVAAAGLFSESVGKVLSIIGTGAEGFAKLGDFRAVSETSIAYFVEAVKFMTDQFVLIASTFEVEGLAAAGTFAEAVGKVVGTIGTGVEGFGQLAALGPVSETAIANFVNAINITMQRLGAAASQFSADAIAHAGKFADAAGAAVGILKEGVDGLLKVDTFAGTSEAAIGRFADGVRLAVAAMARLAAEFGPEATAAAATFAKAAGESTDFFKKGVDGFVKLDKITALPQASMDVFSDAIVLLVNTIIQLSNIITTDVLAQAVRFATGMDQVITVMSDALKAIANLGGDAAGISPFLQVFTNTVANIARDFANQVVPPATNIGLNIAVGIANGINMGTPAIQNAIYAAVAAAIAAAKAALGIASPSKVFEAQIGAQMGAGAAQGVLRSIPMVTDAVGQMSRGAVGAGAANNSRSVSVSFAPGSIVVQGAPGQDTDALADAVADRLVLKAQGILA